MAHILFVTPYYPPEKGAAMVRINENAKRLAERGYQVTVLTAFPNYPTGIVPPEYRGRLIQHEIRDGVHIVRVWSYSAANRGFLRRVLAQLSFGCLAPLLGWQGVGRPDVIIVESPPLFDAIAGRILALGKRCPFIFWVSDLWPESAVQLGVLHNRVLIWLAELLEWSTYRRTSLVWVVTEGIRNTLIQRGLSAEHIFLLTGGVDATKFHPLPQAQARAELDWDDQFTVLYVGTHGLAHGLTTILDAAEQMQNLTGIRIILVGDGAAKKDLMADAQRRRLGNISFLDSQPHDRVPLLLAASDVCLVPLRKLPLFEGALPSKMYEAMACARPIVLGVEGIARQLVEQETGAAIYVEPENAEALASAILYLRDHPNEAKILGQRGRALVEDRFDYSQLAAALHARIEMLLEKKSPRSMPMSSAAVSVIAEQKEI